MPKTSTTKRAPRTKSKADIARSIKMMTEQYGPFPQEPRLPPMDELVFTILSQHTSDINSSRAFRRLMERFGTLEEVARGNPAEIEFSISVHACRRDSNQSQVKEKLSDSAGVASARR